MNPIFTKAISKKLKCGPVNAYPDPAPSPDSEPALGPSGVSAKDFSNKPPPEPSPTPEPAELPLESESCANQYCKEGRMSGIWPKCICEPTPAPGPRPTFALEDATSIQIAKPCPRQYCYPGYSWVGYPYCSCMMKGWQTT